LCDLFNGEKKFLLHPANLLKQTDLRVFFCLASLNFSFNVDWQTKLAASQYLAQLAQLN